MARRRRTLGPFPKTKHWREILAEACPGSTISDADASIETLRGRLSALKDDISISNAITRLVAAVIGSREPRYEPKFTDFEGGWGAEALRRILATCSHPVQPELFDSFLDDVWRRFDGSGFADLGRAFFAELAYFPLNEEFLRLTGKPGGEDLRRFASEISLITRTFSARWFNACARDRMPPAGSVRWYVEHCLGKLDLELEREKSDWTEPVDLIWRRVHEETPSFVPNG